MITCPPPPPPPLPSPPLPSPPLPSPPLMCRVWQYVVLPIQWAYMEHSLQQSTVWTCSHAPQPQQWLRCICTHNTIQDLVYLTNNMPCIVSVCCTVRRSPTSPSPPPISVATYMYMYIGKFFGTASRKAHRVRGEMI